jgi:hypothetical protein
MARLLDRPTGWNERLRAAAWACGTGRLRGRARACAYSGPPHGIQQLRQLLQAEGNSDLARVIAGSPLLLTLDEPFGGLDSKERDILAEDIRQLRERASVWPSAVSSSP